MTAPGLEPFTAAELLALGLAPEAPEAGGVGFTAPLTGLARANLELRTASRILVRLGAFHARALGELERKLGLLPWSDWLPSGTRIQARVSCHKSRLYHQKAIAERVVRASGCAAAPPAGPDGEPDPDTQLVVVRVLRDEVTVSLDSSGALLHRRGYRLETAKAPLRETLAAALLLAGGWDPGTALVDPMCGSGTIAIEAALLARRVAPGAARTFRFRHWRPWEEAAWAPMLSAARGAERPRAAGTIVASDRDAGAIRAARANAERAGVATDIRFVERAISDLERHPGPGQLVSNPPYGVRVSEGRELRDLFARLGQVCRARVPRFGVTLLVPEAPLERATGLPFHELFRTQNGGLLVRAVHATAGPQG